MATFLMVLFIILCIVLGFTVLLQQGKGDLGLGSLGGGGQMLFGGSGGQDFFEKITWVMGALFIFGALGLTILKNKELNHTRAKQTINITQKQQNHVPIKKTPSSKNK